MQSPSHEHVAPTPVFPQPMAAHVEPCPTAIGVESLLHCRVRSGLITHDMGSQHAVDDVHVVFSTALHSCRRWTWCLILTSVSPPPACDDAIHTPPTHCPEQHSSGDWQALPSQPHAVEYTVEPVMAGTALLLVSIMASNHTNRVQMYTLRCTRRSSLTL